jgi:hypothetical protein
MTSKYKNGFDFVSANPPLHAGAKRLHLPPQPKEMLNAFFDLTNEINDELVRFLRGKFKDVKFIANQLPKSMKLDPKMPLTTLLCHCFPICYGLQLRSENVYQKMVNQYLKSRLNDTEKKSREKVTILISTFHQITESKQLLHIIAKKTEMEAINYVDDQQLTLLVKSEIQTHCNGLAQTLSQCRLSIASSNKEENVFVGLISRAKGFSTFTEKKLIAYCDKIA